MKVSLDMLRWWRGNNPFQGLLIGSLHEHVVGHFTHDGFPQLKAILFFSAAPPG